MKSILVLLTFCAGLQAAIIHVPADQPTIQAAIDAAVNHDTVQVAAGTYLENINFKGKIITVESIDRPELTVIDGGSNGSVVLFELSEGPGSVLDGFTLTNGTGTYDAMLGGYCGGGVCCSIFASPSIKNSIIIDNHADHGGGLYTSSGLPAFIGNTVMNNSAAFGGGICCYSGANGGITDCVLSGNSALASGGGVYINLSSPLLTNCALYRNTASNGGGIYCDVNAYPKIRNCTFFENEADAGGAVELYYSFPKLESCILWNNVAGEDPEIRLGLGLITVDYSDVKGGFTGTGNIDMDPLFVDEAGADLHLRQDPCQPGVVNPCVDAGDPAASLIDGATRTDGLDDLGVVDMGFHYMGTLLVPDEHPTIQQAINAAAPWDTIHVAAGTYVETIDFKGKRLQVKSLYGPAVTVIDGSQSGSVVTFADHETQNTQFEGFTLTRGQAAYGGGIYCKSSSPRLSHIIFIENAADMGGGIYCDDAAPVLENCLFLFNTAGGGAAVCCYFDSTPLIVSSTISNNTAVSAAGGVFSASSSPVLLNNILWNNSASTWPEIFETGGSLSVKYCNVAGGYPGTGNMNADPSFVNAAGLDVHLAWDSPCINRGAEQGIPLVDIDGDPRPAAGSNDMGADEFSGVHRLWANPYSFSESAGGTVDFFLTGDAGRNYLLFGSVTGTLPGFPLPNGQAILPINWDPFTEFVLLLINTPAFKNFMGSLDAGGGAQAQLNVGPIPTGFVGLKIHFAFCLSWPWEFVSNPVAVEIVP